MVGENHTAVVDSEKQRWNAFVTTSFHSSVVYYPSVCDSLDTVHLLVYSKSPPLKHRRNEVGISRSIVEVGVTTPVIVVNTDSGSNHASFPTDQDAITFSKAGHRDCLDHEYTVVTTVVYQGGGVSPERTSLPLIAVMVVNKFRRSRRISCLVPLYCTVSDKAPLGVSNQTDR